jgi:hypothetical protein
MLRILRSAKVLQTNHTLMSALSRQRNGRLRGVTRVANLSAAHRTANSRDPVRSTRPGNTSGNNSSVVSVAA